MEFGAGIMSAGRCVLVGSMFGETVAWNSGRDRFFFIHTGILPWLSGIKIALIYMSPFSHLPSSFPVSSLLLSFLASASAWVLPVSAGVLAGCGGMFLSCGRGVSLLSQGVPWAMQSALYGSVYYYCAGVSAGARAGGGVVYIVGFNKNGDAEAFGVRILMSRALVASSVLGGRSGHFLRFRMVVGGRKTRRTRRRRVHHDSNFLKETLGKSSP